MEYTPEQLDAIARAKTILAEVGLEILEIGNPHPPKP